jgi:CBS domain-containing protein
MKVQEIMSHPVITVPPGLPVKHVAAILVEKRISGVPVADENDRLLGIVTEADLLPLETEPDPRSQILPSAPGQEPLPVTAEEAMTHDVICLGEDADVAEAARMMLERNVKRIPIIASGRVVGIVSRRDILKVLARTDDEIQLELRDLLDDEIMMMGRFRAEVSGGVVVLRGPRDERERRLATRLAKSVPGVVEVRFAEEAASPRRA